MTELPLTVFDAAQALRQKQISSVELTKAAFAYADDHDAQLGVYLARFDDAAMESARRADADLARGLDRGPLQGVTVGIKDILATAEGPTTANSLALTPGWGEGQDATVVKRLRAGGTVITGKLTAGEFALGAHDSEKPHPRPRNPWNPATWPCGSSSGTAVGIAADMMLAGIGTDTGGSIRGPAAFCGVSGLVPTYGRVPATGSVPVAYSLDHIGPMARSIQDCGLVLAAISGADGEDPYAAPVAPFTMADRASQSLAGMRIGVERAHHLGVAEQDPALERIFEAALDVLRALGATVVDVEISHYDETRTAHTVTVLGEAFAYHRQNLRRRWNDYYRTTRAMTAAGALFSAADYVQAQRVRRIAQLELANLFRDVDLIVTPTTGIAAPSYHELDAHGMGKYMNSIFTGYWDAVGNPVLAMPMGFTADNMPLSIQIAARPFDDARLIEVGAAYQSQTDWHLRRGLARVGTPEDAVSPPTEASDGRPLHTMGRVSSESDQDASVRVAAAAALDAIGLAATEAERAAMLDMHALTMPGVERLHELTDEQDEVAALIFRADPGPLQ